MAYIGYLFFRFIVWIFAFIPFSLLYKIADFTQWLLFAVFKYRKKIVIQQLSISFPHMSDAEIDRIARASYQNLADIILESIKGFTMNEAEFRSRYKLANPELSESKTSNTRSTIHIAAHYGNWEWGAISYPLWFTGTVLGFYKPLSNRYIEKYGKVMRGRFDMLLIPISDTAKAFTQYANDGATYVFVSDQSTWSDKAHWVTFLGQDTACPPGADKYARQLHCPVFFIDIQRVRRGYYEVGITMLSDGKESLPEGEITARYMRKLEEIIVKQPENWLWSHKRWKKKR
jgi:Kdo2-lipid IVA lauroyltransferase/acyltransferase